MKSPDALVPFTYEEFQVWHERTSQALFIPAELTAKRVVTELLQPAAGNVGTSRIRLQGSRVKTPGRTWTKLLSNEKYYSNVASIEDVPQVIDDLVGLRIVCSNLTDIHQLQDLLSELEPETDTGSSDITFEGSSRRDYFDKPKPSGYRAFHLNLVVPVPSLAGNRRVRVELQARTLLQDGWGELTHEDTYKPGVAAPPWIQQMSRRMADLLEVVDYLAQDIRDELDQLSADSVETQSDRSEVTPAAPGRRVKSDPVVTPTPLTPVLFDEVRKAVAALDRPTTLASVAHSLQVVLGTGISQTWGGYQSFKALLQAAVPSVQLIEQAPGYVLPTSGPASLINWEMEPESKSILDPSLPAVLKHLKSIDRDFPLISGANLRSLLEFVARALAGEGETTVDYEVPTDPSSASMTDVNALSKAARSVAEAEGRSIARTHATYVLKALLFSKSLKAGLSEAAIRSAFVSVMANRLSAFGLEEDGKSTPTTVSNWIKS